MAKAAVPVTRLLRSVILELLTKAYGWHQHVAEQKLWGAQAKDDPTLPDPIPYQYYDEHGKLHEGKVPYQQLRFGRSGPKINQAYPPAKIPPSTTPSSQRRVFRFQLPDVGAGNLGENPLSSRMSRHNRRRFAVAMGPGIPVFLGTRPV
jgi:hypothetical protein